MAPQPGHATVPAKPRDSPMKTSTSTEAHEGDGHADKRLEGHEQRHETTVGPRRITCEAEQEPNGGQRTHRSACQ